MDQFIDYQSFDFGLVLSALFSSNQNILLSDIGPLTTSGVLSDNDGFFIVGEQVTLDGVTLTMRGSGTIQPGIELLSIIIPTGFPRDVLVFERENDGQLFFAYPEGPPNLLSGIAAVLSVDEIGYDTNTNTPLCFCAGTLVETPQGERRVETLTEGDHLVTAGGDTIAVQAVLSTTLRAPRAGCLPVVLEPDSLAPGFPRKRLRLSPHHRICMPDSDPAGKQPWLAPALAFACLPRVRRKARARSVNYIHVVTERHALVIAEGVPVETLLVKEARGGDAAMGFDGPAIAKALGLPVEALRNHPAARPAGRLLPRRKAETLLAAWDVTRGLTPGAQALHPGWTRRVRQRNMRLVVNG